MVIFCILMDIEYRFVKCSFFMLRPLRCVPQQLGVNCSNNFKG